MVKKMMPKSVVLLSTCLVFFLFSPLPGSPSGILLDDYKSGLSPKWEEKSFRGKTIYKVTTHENQLCIKATSHSSASALLYKINYDPKDLPILTWRWKIDHILPKGNALTKEGDDYAARVYIVFPSSLFWKTRALSYIWANKLPKGHVIPNSFNSNSMMIAVESGSTQTGRWVVEKRNVLDDYRRAFGQDPPNAGAIAIMTDTDNTGEKTVAYYGPIRILPDSVP
jgi:hypothetical protein